MFEFVPLGVSNCPCLPFWSERVRRQGLVFVCLPEWQNPIRFSQTKSCAKSTGCGRLVGLLTLGVVRFRTPTLNANYSGFTQREHSPRLLVIRACWIVGAGFLHGLNRAQD